MTTESTQMRLMVAKAATLAGVVSVLVVGVAYGIAKATGRPMLAQDIAMAGGVLLLAGLPGLVLSAALTGRLRGGASLGFVAGAAIRLPAGGVVALNGINWGLAQTQSFPQIVAAAYLVLLVIEVLILSPAVKRTAAIEAKPPAVENTPGVEESV